MSRLAWQPLNKVTIGKLEINSLGVIARPDGKSWSGILVDRTNNGLALRNANVRFDLHYALNPTASFQVLTLPKWELGFGQPRLPLG